MRLWHEYRVLMPLGILMLLATTAWAETVVRCGPATLTLQADKQGKVQIIATTGLPDGLHPFDVKDGEIYLNGHMCKPVCSMPAERRC